MAREYPERPLVGAGAVIIHQGRVALVRRASAPRRGEWSIPGGLVELGETLRQAAEREALEETGLTVKAGEVLEVFESLERDSAGKVLYHYVVVDFECQLTSGELRAGSDVSDARWASENELAALGVSEAATKVIRKGFAKLRG
ncbi:MAG TPA: NUDIX hydrolase [Terriglobales bacterium]|nr:NUDIX hydrolase [Terriglobales bacterium]